MSRIFVSGALYLGIVIGIANGQSCAEDKVRKCMTIAEPMLKDPHLIFPDNMNDINNVCRTWSNFVDCIRRYIDKCFSKVRKDQFNSAVEPPIASVHQMCSVSSYQAEYLQYAGCIKSTIIEAEHCGKHYSVLVNEVSQENVRKANLCCAYHNFRSCVIMKTRLRCDNNQAEGIAARFSRQVLDKAFHFLQDQCLNYIPDTGKCSAMMQNSSGGLSISRLGEGRSVTLESGQSRGGSNGAANTNAPSRKSPILDVYRGKASDVYDTVTNTAQSTSSRHENNAHVPNYSTNLDTRTSIGSLQTPVTSGPSFGSTQARQSLHQQQQHEQQQQAAAAVNYAGKSGGKVNDDRFAKAEEGTSRKAEPAHYTPIVENSVPIATATQRSGSYGRGISWTTPTTPSTSEIPDWATNTWLTHSQDLTTEEIYPAAGSFGGNNIDEPNQQGLSRNGQSSVLAAATTLLYIFIFCASYALVHN